MLLLVQLTKQDDFPGTESAEEDDKEEIADFEDVTDAFETSAAAFEMVCFALTFLCFTIRLAPTELTPLPMKMAFV